MFPKMEGIVTTPAKIAANIENAKKSTGPRSAKGKERSRMNALRHGLTAEVLLPDEDVEEFRKKQSGWVQSLEPRDPVELAIAERAFYYSWQVDRVVRTQWARLSVRARTKAEADQQRTEQEVGALGRKLFRMPNGRPAAVMCRAVGDATNGTESSPSETSVADAEHPASLIGLLEATGPGCRWLMEQFRELQAILESDGVWHAPERFRDFRLCRFHRSDAYFNRHLTKLLHACEVLDPAAGRLIGEVWYENTPVAAMPALEEAYQRAVVRYGALDQTAARGYLLDMVHGELERLGGILEGHEQREDIESALADHLLAFDDSKEAALLRRYEASCSNQMHRNMKEITTRHNAGAERGGNELYGMREAAEPYAGSLEAQFMQRRAERLSMIRNARAMTSDLVTAVSDSSEGRNGHVRNEPTDAPLRNEPTDAPLRNEPTGRRCAVAGSDGELRNGAAAAFANRRVFSTGEIAEEPTRVDAASQDQAKSGLMPGDSGKSVPAISLKLEEDGAMGNLNPSWHRCDRGHRSALGGSRRQRKARERKRRNAERAAAANG
jgi:hypothetical protein